MPKQIDDFKFFHTIYEEWKQYHAIGTIEEITEFKKVTSEKLNDIIVISNWVEYIEEEVRQDFVKFLQAEQEGRILPDCKECTGFKAGKIMGTTPCYDCCIGDAKEKKRYHFEPAAKEED